MADYSSWNRAIVAYSIAGTAKGAPIFLSIDDEAIGEVGKRFLEGPLDGPPVDDFVHAVRKRCVYAYNATVSISDLWKPINGIPGGVGFLGLMVLAAHDMQDEEGIDESNYFLRLRLRLGLSGKGRPEGMPPGTEEPLWQTWSKYLVDSGFQETAEQGLGPQKYLHYVLSQAILRESDKQYLRQTFEKEKVPLQLDCNQLGFWLSQRDITRQHLKEGLHNYDLGRVWEFYRAAYQVYDAGDWAGYPPKAPGQAHERRRSIECGLYRTENLIGESSYRLFPRQTAHMKAGSLSVTPPKGEPDILQRLLPLRDGFFRPLWKQDPFVEHAYECEVRGDPQVERLLFPKRDFWILTRDPDNHYGPWATWNPYLKLGDRLLVLCRGELFHREMERFRDAKLLEWADCLDCGGWKEYRECMILSYEWGGFISEPKCRALADALAPRVMASISITGGLRDPNQNVWLEGFPPAIKVYGFEENFDLTVTSAKGVSVFSGRVERQHEVALPPGLEPGTYQIAASWAGNPAAVRLFRIIPWRAIQGSAALEEIRNASPVSTGGLMLRGAMILTGCTNDREGK